MQIERSTRKRREIGLTPLIDVVFQLLLFFMLSTSFIRTESMELSIPKAGDSKLVPSKGIIRVFVEDAQTIRLASQVVSEQELRTELRLALVKDPERPVLLLAGQEVNVQRLVDVMDMVNVMGGRNVSVSDWKK